MRTTTLTNLVTGQTKTVEQLVDGSWGVFAPSHRLVLGSASSAAKYVRALVAMGTWAATEG